MRCIEKSDSQQDDFINLHRRKDEPAFYMSSNVRYCSQLVAEAPADFSRQRVEGEVGEGRIGADGSGFASAGWSWRCADTPG